MMKAFRLYLRKPTVAIGLATALLFQVIFAVVWLTAYDGVLERIDRLKVVLVNEDPFVGKKIESKLIKQLPFEVSISKNLIETKEQLSERKQHMIIHFPKDFSQKISKGTTIQYYINESNPLMVKNAMQGVANQVTAIVNQQATKQGMEKVLAQSKMPTPVIKQITDGLVNPVNGSIHRVHPVDSFANQMIPLLLLLPTYIGAMLFNVQLMQSSRQIRGTVSKWADLGSRILINVITSLLVPIAGVSLIVSLSEINASFFELWLYLTLIFFSFVFVSQVFLYLFGDAGMLFNIIMLSLQIAISGAMVPIDLLSDFYQNLSAYLPATYAIYGGMDLLFGGGDVLAQAATLSLFPLVSLVIIVLRVTLQKEQSWTESLNQAS